MTIDHITQLLLAILAIGIFYSRHRLSKRHRECKDALSRVASQRNSLMYFGERFIAPNDDGSNDAREFLNECDRIKKYQLDHGNGIAKHSRKKFK